MDELTYMTKKEIDAKYDRIGKCKQCGACCKMIVLNAGTPQQDKYLSHFGFKKVRIGDKFVMVLHKNCDKLKNNKCTLHGKKSQPVPCRQFPAPECQVYALCKRKCGIQFGHKERVKMSY